MLACPFGARCRQRDKCQWGHGENGDCFKADPDTPADAIKQKFKKWVNGRAAAGTNTEESGGA